MNSNRNSKWALIVGASRGLGLGLVTQLLARNWSIVATVRDASRADDLNALKQSHADRLQILELDILDPAPIGQLAEAFPEGLIDFAFINAGVLGPQHQSVSAATAHEMGDLFMANAVAPVRFAQRIAPLVRMPGGSIGFMSSRMGSVADNETGGLDLYRASKAALNSLTRGFVAGLGADASVLTLHPGWVRTEMGGADAPLDVETSTRGLADVIETNLGRPGHHFLDYAGQTVPW